MRYIFRANVHGRGNSLFLCEPGGDLRELPLDVASSELLANFIDGQRHIDRLIGRDPARPYFRVSSWGASSLALFGCQFPGTDQYGRAGITLVCGFSGHRDEAFDLAGRVVMLASSHLFTEVGDLVSQVAAGRAEPAALVAVFNRAFPRQLLPWPPASGTDSPPFGTVVHDCGGVALAWQAMTHAHSRTAESWAVFDDLDPADNRTTVTRSAEQGGQRILLSDYIRLAANVVASAVTTQHLPSEGTTHQVPSQRRSVPSWLKPRAWATGFALSALVNVVAVIALLVNLFDSPPPQQQPSFPRVIAQYEYRFELPNGWLQTGGDPAQLSSEIGPRSAEPGARIVVQENRRINEASYRAKLEQDAIGEGAGTIIGLQQQFPFADRDVLHYITLDDKGSPTEWYLLFHGDVLVKVGCQHFKAVKNTVLSACETVVRSMDIAPIAD